MSLPHPSKYDLDTEVDEILHSRNQALVAMGQPGKAKRTSLYVVNLTE